MKGIVAKKGEGYHKGFGEIVQCGRSEGVIYFISGLNSTEKEVISILRGVFTKNSPGDGERATRRAKLERKKRKCENASRQKARVRYHEQKDTVK